MAEIVETCSLDALKHMLLYRDRDGCTVLHRAAQYRCVRGHRKDFRLMTGCEVSRQPADVAGFVADF